MGCCKVSPPQFFQNGRDRIPAKPESIHLKPLRQAGRETRCILGRETWQQNLGFFLVDDCHVGFNNMKWSTGICGDDTFNPWQQEFVELDCKSNVLRHKSFMLRSHLCIQGRLWHSTAPHEFANPFALRNLEISWNINISFAHFNTPSEWMMWHWMFFKITCQQQTLGGIVGQDADLGN